MKIYLLRHADYVLDPNTHIDSLTPKGKRQLDSLKSFIQPLKIDVPTLYHSPKNRAYESAEIIRYALNSKAQLSVHPGLNPLDSAKLFADEMIPMQTDLFVVGHLPFLGVLASYLLVNDEHKSLISFEPGTLALIENSSSYAAWSIRWVIQAELYS